MRVTPLLVLANVTLGPLGACRSREPLTPDPIVCTVDDRRPHCQPSGGPVSAAGLVVTPDNVLKEVDVFAPVSHEICYRARVVYLDGVVADVSAVSAWTLDRLGAAYFRPDSTCLLTSNPLRAGGLITIYAQFGKAKAAARLILRLRGVHETNGVGVGLLGGPVSTEAAPTIVYPLAGAMFPRNLPRPTIQFVSTASATVFAAHFTSPTLDYTITFRPTRCDGARCEWEVPSDDWHLVATTDSGVEAKLVLSAASGDPGAPVASAAGFPLSFSPDDLAGALYYFSTSLPGVMRAIVGKGDPPPIPRPFVAPGPSPAGRPCAGCHAITQDGSRIALRFGHEDPALGIVNTSAPETRTLEPGVIKTTFQTFNSDGTRLLTSLDGALTIRDGVTGAEISKVAPEEIGPTGRQRAAMPAWSNDGKRIAFVRLLAESATLAETATRNRPAVGGDWLLADAGEIATLSWDGTSANNSKVLVGVAPERREFHFYPSFSPDDGWLVFNTASKPGFSPIAQDPGAGFSYGVPAGLLVTAGQRDARLRLVRSTGGTPIELTRATVSVGSTASWPRFTPFLQRGSRLSFIVFSSKMDYGFHVTGGARAQLWLATIDIGRIGETNDDPSYAPIWLPFQEETASNHLGAWTTKVPCTVECSPGDHCVAGTCLPGGG